MNDELIRYAILITITAIFFVALYYFFIPDVRFFYVIALGAVVSGAYVYTMRRLLGILASDFEPVEFHPTKLDAQIFISLSISSLLIFLFIYLSMFEYSHPANFYVSLAITSLIIGVMMFTGKFGIPFMPEEPDKGLTAAVAGILFVALFSGVAGFLLGTAVTPVPAAVTFALPVRVYLMFIVLWVALAAIVEELFFRGGIVPMVASSQGVAPAAITTSFIFVMFHYVAYGLDVHAIAYLFVLSVILTYAAVYSRSVGVAMLMHLLNNMIAVVQLIATYGGWITVAGYAVTLAILLRRR